MRMFQDVVNSPGVFDDEGEFERYPSCDHGLHYYNEVKTCSKCGTRDEKKLPTGYHADREYLFSLVFDEVPVLEGEFHLTSA